MPHVCYMKHSKHKLGFRSSAAYRAYSNCCNLKVFSTATLSLSTQRKLRYLSSRELHRGDSCRMTLLSLFIDQAASLSLTLISYSWIWCSFNMSKQSPFPITSWRRYPGGSKTKIKCRSCLWCHSVFVGSFRRFSASFWALNALNFVFFLNSTQSLPHLWRRPRST